MGLSGDQRGAEIGAKKHDKMVVGVLRGGGYLPQVLVTTMKPIIIAVAVTSNDRRLVAPSDS